MHSWGWNVEENWHAVNDCALGDVWPVLARFVTFGYGSSGRFGFGGNRIRDRFFEMGHSGFFDDRFVRQYWIPYLTEGRIVEGVVDRPKTAWWLSVLGIARLPYVVLAVFLLAVTGPRWWPTFAEAFSNAKESVTAVTTKWFSRSSADSTQQSVRFVPQVSVGTIAPRFLEFRPNHHSLLVLNRYGRIDVLDLKDWNRPVKTIEINTGARTVAFGPDGSLIVSGGYDGMVRLWDSNGRSVGEPPPIGRHAARVESIAFSADGTRVVSGGSDGSVRLWDVSLNGLTTLGRSDSWRQHDGAVRKVAFVGDSRVISGGSDGALRLWEIGEGRLSLEGVQRVPGSSQVIVAFSSDGKRAVYSDRKGTIGLWDVDSGVAIGSPVRAHEDTNYSSVDIVASFKLDGTRLATVGERDGMIRLWAVDDDGLQVIDARTGHDNIATSVAFSSDGTLIVSCDSDTLLLWDATSGAPIGQPIVASSDDRGMDRAVIAVAYVWDTSRVVSVTGDGTVRSWKLDEENRASAALTNDLGSPSRVVVSRDGSRIVSGDYDGVLQVWSVDENRGMTRIASLGEGHEGYIASVALSDDRTLAISGDSEGTLRLWDVRRRTIIGDPLIVTEQRNILGRPSVTEVAFSSDGKLAVSSASDGWLRLWNVEYDVGLTPRGKPQRSEARDVTGLLFSPSDTVIVFGDGTDGTIHLREVADWNEAKGRIIGTHEQGVNALAFHSDESRIVSAGDDGTIRTWSVELQGAIGTPLRADRDWVETVAFNRDGTRTVSGGFDGTVRLWAAESLNSVGLPLNAVETVISKLVLSGLGKLIVRSEEDDSRVVLLDVTEWDDTDEEPLRSDDWLVGTLGTTEDGTRAVWIDPDAFVHYWNIEKWDHPEDAIGLEFYPDLVWSAAVSRDGERIVLGRDNGTVQVWDVEREVGVGESLSVSDGPVRSVAFGRDEKRIATGGDDGTARVWNMEERRPIGQPMRGEGNTVRVSRLAFSPDGERVVIGSSWGPIEVWDVDNGEIVATEFPCIGYDVRWLNDSSILTRCHDRFIYYSSELDRRGDLFLLDDGLIAVAFGKGVYASNPELSARVFAFDNQTQRVDLSSRSIEEMRHLLFEYK